MESRGRDGMLYYTENGRSCSMYYEMSGVEQYDILINFESLAHWQFPENEKIGIGEKSRIRELLKRYLAENNIRGQIS